MATNRDSVLPARITAKPIPERYARGWHYIGLPSDFASAPVSLKGFGTQLVGFRGDNGQVNVLDGYCPHMGGALAKGYVDGDSIRCPFHEWRWGSDGICKGIPYAKRIPAKARIKSWPVMQANGQLFVWHCPQESVPPPVVSIPDLDICSADAWTDWVIRTTVIPTNCRELIDNVSDKAHFGSVHHSAAAEFTNVFEGHLATQIMRGVNDSRSEFDDSAEMLSTATYYGPAVMYVDMKQTINGQFVESIWFNAHRPIDINSFELYFGVKMKWIEGMSEAESRQFLEAYATASQRAFDEDVDIWTHKTRVDNPILCDGDGPINLLRQWYEQFYTDIDKVSDRWRTRREIVV